jgi:hypothetical protein
MRLLRAHRAAVRRTVGPSRINFFCRRNESAGALLALASSGSVGYPTLQAPCSALHRRRSSCSPTLATGLSCSSSRTNIWSGRVPEPPSRWRDLTLSRPAMRTRPSPFSLFATMSVLSFTDLHMPGSMDGLKLAHFVRDRWPPVKIVATSARVRITASDLPEGGRFLPKPYSAADIAATLHELIQG